MSRIKRWLVFFWMCFALNCNALVSAQNGITAPGTKWCGPGNTANHYDDLGHEAAADMCCRAHDHCHESIKSQTVTNGLQNDEWLPIFRCHCEDEFRACLQTVNKLSANAIGRVYFNSRSRCYDFGYPIIGCEERQWDMFRQRCLKYKVDSTQSKIWQFYDLPFFTIKTNDDDDDDDADDALNADD